MRKTAIILSLLVLATLGTFAQSAVEFIPTAGYTFADRNDFYDTYGRIAGGLNLGGSVKFNLNQRFGIELLYSHMNTNSGLYQYGYENNKLAGGDLALDYIMIGGVQSFTIPNSTVRPFIGAFLGAAVLTPGGASSADYSSDTKFAVGLQLGTNIYISPRFGFQFKAQMLSPVDEASGGLWFGGYNGSSISTYSTIYQFSVNGGLIIGLGKVLPAEVYHRPRPHPRYRRYYY